MYSFVRLTVCGAAERKKAAHAGHYFAKLSCDVSGASACQWSTDRINTSKVEIKPQQSETLTHFHLGVHPILTRRSSDQALSQRTFFFLFRTSGQCGRYTHLYTYTQVNTHTHTNYSLSRGSPGRRLAFFSLQFIVNYHLSSQQPE